MKELLLIAGIILSVKASFAQTTQDLGRIVVTASRIAQQEYEVAGNLTVIDAEQIAASNAQTIPDIVKEALGVSVYSSGTVKSSVVDIRGFGDTAARNVLVLIDGRKINTVDVSAPDLLQVPLESVERIEILRGAGTVLYGDNATGGVVSIITKKGKGEFSGRVGSSYGSYSKRKVDAEVSGEHKSLSYYLYSKYDDHRSFRDNGDLLSKDFSSRLAYALNDNFAVDLSLGWHDDSQGLPGGLTEAQIRTMGRKGTANPTDISHTKDRFVKLGTSLKPWPEDVNYGEFLIDYYYRNRDVRDEFNAFGAFHTKRNTDTHGITGKYVFDRTVFGQDVNFVTGVDYFDSENDIRGAGSNSDDITITKEEIGIYGFGEYELVDDVFVNAGTRYHEAKYTFDQRNVTVYQTQRPDEWASMGGVKWLYAPGSALHWNAQQTFRFLATDEWYSTANFPSFGITPGLNLNLRQQTGVQFEAGIKHSFGDKVILSLTPYWMDLNNEVYFDPVTFANRNFDKTRRTGVEFGQQYDLKEIFSIDDLQKLQAFVNYTFQKPEQKSGSNDGEDIPFAARHQAQFGLMTEVVKYVRLSLTSNYMGSRYRINDLANRAPKVKPHITLDTKVAYVRENYEIYAAVNNLTDQKYDDFVSTNSSLTTVNFFPADERNYELGVNIKF